MFFSISKMSDNPIDLLKEEMDSDEISLRVNAIHRTKIIASIIGFDGIKNTLLPYFDSLMKKEDDEVLFAIAEELGNLRFIQKKTKLNYFLLFFKVIFYQDLLQYYYLT